MPQLFHGPNTATSGAWASNHTINQMTVMARLRSTQPDIRFERGPPPTGPDTELGPEWQGSKVPCRPGAG